MKLFDLAQSHCHTVHYSVQVFLHFISFPSDDMCCMPSCWVTLVNVMWISI